MNKDEVENKVKQCVEEVKNLPHWIQLTGIIFGILGTFGTLYGLWGTHVVAESRKNVDLINFATQHSSSTTPISELLANALEKHTLIEVQDFIKKYTNLPVHGRGTVYEVSRAGEGFLIDINIWVGLRKQIVTCQLTGGDEQEREVLLMKGKTVNFTGVYENSNIWGHGLGIGTCLLEVIK